MSIGIGSDYYPGFLLNKWKLDFSYSTARAQVS